MLVGRDAERGARIDPGRYEPHPKRRMTDGELLLGPTEVPVAAAIGTVFARVVEQSARALGGPPGRVVLSHPAGWGAQRRAVLVDAARRAGLGDPSLVAEPVAAAVHFTGVLGQRVEPGAAVVVYDFGGGTFDVSVLRRRDDQGWDVVAAAGLDDVGGVDLDAAVVEHIGAVAADHDTAVWERVSQPESRSGSSLPASPRR